MKSSFITGSLAIVFTDIEGSTRLWEQEPERMPAALAKHDALVRKSIEAHQGTLVTTSGDGVFAAFADARDAVDAVLEMQRALHDPNTTAGIPLRIRCGLHWGVVEHRDNDYFGSAVNRAARIMGTAHGGQVLLSQAAADLVRDRLPADVGLRDLGAVRLRDLAKPERIHQILHPQLRQEFPALRSLEATPNNLPQQTTTFIGRERESTEVRNALGTARLLTLVGAGGMGKTRLSLQIAADVLEAFPDGVWFIELASLADERLVPQAVASVLGVKEEAGHSVTEALTAHVADRQLLLVLDNCEHLVRACAELVSQLLKCGPQLRVLASSREPLRIAGETSFPVPALAVPSVNKPQAGEVLSHYPAVRLFVDRASAVLPAFQLTDRNVALVVDICHRLDGIPLAIELAAARVRSLPVEIIAARLSDRFRLLTRGDRTVLPRQQTLRALIDWSYDLLSEQERTLLRRLAVFAGGWTLDSAECVVAGGDLDATAVVDMLGNLVEKSLVELEIEGERYRLLETIREYARQHLDESDEADAVRTRHLTCYLAFAEDVRPKLVGPEQGAWLARLDREMENLLAAHAWSACAAGGTELGLQLVHSVKLYLFNRGLFALLRQWAMEALARPGATIEGQARWRALFACGQAHSILGRFEEANGYLQECLAIARKTGNVERAAAVLQELGVLATGQGDLTTARRHLQEALAIVRESGSRRNLGAALTGLAQLHRLGDELDAAELLYEEVLDLARTDGDREMIAMTLLNLAMVSIGRGAGDRAREMLLEVLAIAGETGSIRAGISLLEVTVGQAAWCKAYDRAARFFGAAEAQTERTGLLRDAADAAFLAPWVAQAREVLGDAAFAAAAADASALHYEDAMREARAWLARRPQR